MSYTVSRKESMSPNGYMQLHMQDDGDIIIHIYEDLQEFGTSFAHVEFCTPFGGGGGSRHTHEALVQLMVGMAKDNLDPGQQARKGPTGEHDCQDIVDHYVPAAKDPFEGKPTEMPYYTWADLLDEASYLHKWNKLCAMIECGMINIDSVSNGDDLNQMVDQAPVRVI